MKCYTTLLSCLALAICWSAQAFAQDISVSDGGFPLDAGVSIWTRYELRDGYDELGVSRSRFIEGDWLVYRARLKLRSKSLKVGDSGLSTKVYFAPQADGFWGDQPGTISAPNLGIYEGYLSLFSPAFRLDVGRFAMNYGDALVIGDLRWHQTGRSFDGARLRLGQSATWLDGFFSVVNEGLRVGEDPAGGNPLVPAGNPSIVGGDVFFAGLYGSIGEWISKGTTLEPYFLSQIWVSDDTGPRPAVQGTGGLRFKQALGSLDFRFEGGVQFGRRRIATGLNPEVFAYQVDGELGFSPSKGLCFSVEGLVASGDDPGSDNLEAYDELFPTTHKFLGLMDVIGFRTNVASGVFHAKYVVGSFVTKFDAHVFTRLERTINPPSFAGVEGDLNLIYVLTKGMSVRLLYALFVPGSDHFSSIDDEGELSTSDDVAQYVELQYGLEI